MTDLSSAAQAVLDAYLNAPCGAPRRVWVAAALCAVADQVAPSDAVEPRNYLPASIECQRIRKELLAIVTELKGHGQ